jgi:hypothetical protein
MLGSSADLRDARRLATDEDNRHAQIGPGQLLLKSSPLRPGSLTSRTRHAGTPWGAVEEFLDRLSPNDTKHYKILHVLLLPRLTDTIWLSAL